MDRETLLDSYEKSGDADSFFKLAQAFEAGGDLELAATAYDRAHGLQPDNEAISNARASVLDQLAIEEHGITFRYIPAGSFLMGSDDGDPDELPVHPVRLDAYWMSETPVSWAKFCELMDFDLPPYEFQREGWQDRQSEQYINAVYELLPEYQRDLIDPEKSRFFTLERALNVDPRICLQYSEDETLQAWDWHSHMPSMEWQKGDGTKTTSAEMFGVPPRENSDADYTYSQKPVVSVAHYLTQALSLRISDAAITYRLPTEAEWEKAARGGLIGAKYAWGDQSPTQDICDFNRFKDFSIRKSKQFPPNGYGLYAMCGGVWEWVSDRYDGRYYENSPKRNPTGSDQGQEYVLRGGSWADDADAVTVSYRSSSSHGGSPNIGFRLCRVN